MKETNQVNFTTVLSLGCCVYCKKCKWKFPPLGEKSGVYLLTLYWTLPRAMVLPLNVFNCMISR